MTVELHRHVFEGQEIALSGSTPPHKGSPKVTFKFKHGEEVKEVPAELAPGKSEHDHHTTQVKYTAPKIPPELAASKVTYAIERPDHPPTTPAVTIYVWPRSAKLTA